MKTLIIYESKYGCTEQCVVKIQHSLSSETEVVKLKKHTKIQLDLYDSVIIGSPVYIGMIRKHVKQFCYTNIEKLKTKQLGLFICCLRDGQYALDELNQAYPQELLDHATVKDYFGGAIEKNKLHFFDKLITKMVEKADQNFPKFENNTINSVNDERMNAFVNSLNNGESYA